MPSAHQHLGHIRAAVRAPSAPTALKCPDQPDLGPAPTQPLPKGQEAWFKLGLSHAADLPTPSPVLAGTDLLPGLNLVLAFPFASAQ